MLIRHAKRSWTWLPKCLSTSLTGNCFAARESISTRTMSRQSGVRTNDSMVDSLKASGMLRTAEVEAVMRQVDRAHYVSFNPYFDSPQSIGYNATISAPHMHALALELLLPSLKGREGGRALDVGSGSGYLTACLALLLGPRGRVVGVEHIPQLVRVSETNVRRDQPALLREGRVHFVVADGRYGYPADAPYAAIHVGAAALEMPDELERQLAHGGRMVIPVGDLGVQRLKLVTRSEDGTVRRMSKMLVAFVPLTDAPEQWSGASAAPRAFAAKNTDADNGERSRRSRRPSVAESRKSSKKQRSKRKSWSKERRRANESSEED